MKKNTNIFEVHSKKYKFGELYHKLNIDLLAHTAMFIERLTGIVIVVTGLENKKIDSSIWLNGGDTFLIKEVIKAQSLESKTGYNDTFLHQMLDVMAYDAQENTWYPLIAYDPDTELFNQKELDGCIEIGANQNPDFHIDLLCQVWVTRLSQYDDMPSILKKKAEEMMRLRGLYTEDQSQQS